MSRSKTLIPCSPLTFLSLFIAITMVASSSGLYLECEIAGDLAVVADPPAVLLEAERVVPVVVVVAQAVPLETFGLQLGTDQCACVDLAAVVIGNAQRS